MWSNQNKSANISTYSDSQSSGRPILGRGYSMTSNSSENTRMSVSPENKTYLHDAIENLAAKIAEEDCRERFSKVLNLAEEVKNVPGDPCHYCLANNKPANDHTLKVNGILMCPQLKKLGPCRICGAAGEFNHTIRYCPQNKSGCPMLTKEQVKNIYGEMFDTSDWQSWETL